MVCWPFDAATEHSSALKAPRAFPARGASSVVNPWGMELATGTVVDRYTVEGQLGQGGMAVVYRVRHKNLGTLHALKVLLLPAQAIRDRLVQEGRVQARLRDPHIVNVTDLVDVDGSPGLVMEYVAGPSVDELLRQVALSVDQADLLSRGILAGVESAHEAGLVHRDLKPGNILLEVRKDRLVPKITDFGLAKLMGDDGAAGNMTRSGLAMGTPCYMAPEQIRNAKGVDARADVFSLGAVLYELLTGRRAFDGGDTFEIFSAVTSGQYTPVAELVPTAPARMVNAIEAALRISREERVQSVSELLRLWVAGTDPPDVAVAFAPAILARAEELGTGGEESPIGSAPDQVAPQPNAPPPTPVPSSETMDWSLGEDDQANAPEGSLAPVHVPQAQPVSPPAPQSQASQSGNRGPVVKRLIAGVVLLSSMGFAAMIGVGALGGAWMLQPEMDGDVISQPAAAEPTDNVTRRMQTGDEAAEPEDDGTRDIGTIGGPASGGAGAGGGMPLTPAPRPAPAPAPAPAAAPSPSPAVGVPPPVPEPPDVVADPDLASGNGEGPDGEEAKPEEPAAELQMGVLVLKVQFHRLTPGAEASAKVWVVNSEGRYEEGEVPAGSYTIEAQWTDKGTPQRVGSLTISEGRTTTLTCYTSTQVCKH